MLGIPPRAANLGRASQSGEGCSILPKLPMPNNHMVTIELQNIPVGETPTAGLGFGVLSSVESQDA